MEQKDLLYLCLEHYQLHRLTNHKERKKDHRLCLELRKSTNTCMAMNLLSVLTTTLYSVYCENLRLSLKWPLDELWWAVMLGAYEYSICYRPSKDHGNADILNCLPFLQIGEDKGEKEHVLMLQNRAGPLTTSEHIKQWTSKDPVLSRVLEYMLKGWQDHSDTQEFIQCYCVLLFQSRDVWSCWNNSINPT